MRPYKGFAAIQEEESVVNSMYNGLQVTWSRRFTAGSLFNVAYTFSKSMDNSSNYRDIVPDTYNTSNLWGPSEYDTRHVVIINYLYDVAVLQESGGLVRKAARGLGNQRSDAVPDGNALRHRNQQRFRGSQFNRSWQFRMRLRRPVLGSQRNTQRGR